MFDKTVEYILLFVVRTRWIVTPEDRLRATRWIVSLYLFRGSRPIVPMT